MTGHTLSAVHADSIVRLYVDRFATGDVDGWLALFTEDAEIIDPVPGPLRRGRGELRRFVTRAMQTFEGVDFQVLDVIVGDERDAVMLFRMSRIDQPTVVAHGSAVFRFNSNGLISEMRGYWVPERLAG